jgi:two-component system NtrC family sensor kinase
MGEDGVVVMEKTGKVEYVNSMACAITGFSREELCGKGVNNFLSADYLPVFAEMEEQIKDNPGKKVCTEMRIVDKSGEARHCEVWIASDKAGRDRKLYMYMRDITERKRMETQVYRSEEKYRRLFDSIRHGIFESSREGKFVDCNQALLSMLGYESKEEFLALDLATDVWEHPEDRKAFQEIVEANGYVKNYDVTYKRKNGELINVLLTCETIANERDEVVGYRGMMMDITRRKKAEKDLKEANRFLNMLIEASPDGIIVTDAKGEIIMYNKAAERLLGYTTDEVIGKANIKSLYPKGIARKIRELLMDDRLGYRGVLPPTELFVKNKWGQIVDISLSASILHGEKGEEIAAIGIFKDMEEMVLVRQKLKETQDQLFQAERLAAMGRLASRIAHEVNNPLYGIMNTLELMKTAVPEKSKRRELLDMSQAEVTRLSMLVKNMLAFSRQEEEARKEIDINKFLQNILTFLDKQIQESGIRLAVDCEPNLPLITVSPGQMTQVILNIVKNAIEAMPHGGMLAVTTKCLDGVAEVTIQDTGEGMNEEVKGRIFDAFFTTKEQAKGVGLGLSVCYGIVHDHGGEIAVESAPGKGASFKISLPIGRNQDR